MGLSFDLNIDRVIHKINLASEVAVEQAHVFIDQLTELGAQAAREKLDAETTKYGEKRFSEGRGGSAGRNDRGEMISKLVALGSSVDDNDTVYGSVGWENPEAYQYAQELGGGNNIPAANSLFAAEEVMMNNVARLGKNMKERVRYRVGR